MKKALIAIVLVVMAPFLLLVPVIGAASSVDGFFDPDSGEDFDVENYKTSDTVLKITSWYEEYISEYEKQLNDRKKEVEKEHTTTETVPKEKPQNPSEEKEIKTESRKVTKKPQLIVGNKDRDQKSDEMTLYDPDEPSTKPGGPSAKPGGPPAKPGGTSAKPGGTSGDKGNAQESDDGSEGEDGEQETETQETEQREVCHVNVIIKMDEFPVSAVLAYYHVRVIKSMLDGDGIKPPKKDDIKDMLAAMTSCTEKPDDTSEDYHITMTFKSYKELPGVMFTKWQLSEEKLSEYTERYLNVTEMVSGWIDENLSAFEKEDAEENTDGE